MIFKRFLIASFLLPLLFPASALSEQAETTLVQPVADLSRTYRRALPLAGGSNFRDLGGYRTQQGTYVKRGVLFRSGAMVSLTDTDIDYLNQFDFQTVVDLRSLEERELYPNRWFQEDQHPALLAHDYKMQDLMEASTADMSSGANFDMSRFYHHMADSLVPQLKLYFSALLEHKVPLVVNCSAGQDRTGFTGALVLSALGVSRDLVVEDFLLSTDFRETSAEQGQVDLEKAAETNYFARLMLAYSAHGQSDRPNPLLTGEGQPFIELALEHLDEVYGGVEGYLKARVGLTDDDILTLRSMYLTGSRPY